MLDMYALVVSILTLILYHSKGEFTQLRNSVSKDELEYHDLEVIASSQSVDNIKRKYGSIKAWLGPGEWWAFRDSQNLQMVVQNTKYTVEQMFSNETIFLRKLNESNINTCYELKTTEFKLRRFCYPAIMITGYPKCGTSAVFDLIASHPSTRTVGARGKENCHRFVEADEAGTLSRFWFLKTLKKEFYTLKDKYLVDGCIYTEFNIRVNMILRKPNTLYIVIIRDFPTFLWSYYNYWCRKGYDDDCNSGNWAIPGSHKRSPELFHEMVTGGSTVNNPLITKDPCGEASSFFKSYLEALWRHVPKHKTVVVANEQLETKPEEVWAKIAKTVGLPEVHPNVGKFKRIRFNTQSKKGAESKQDYSEYRKGTYNISNFMPMKDMTRAVLNKCWKPDCVWISAVAGYQYPSCATT
jgi:Sulfotransferase domain